jgi:hypothetical protein
MEVAQEVKKASEKKPKSGSKLIVRKFDPETYKILASLKERANKKQFGRKVREMEIIQLSLQLLTEAHLKELQASTLSEQDKLMQAHSEYCKTNTKVSLDQFIGLLIRGEINASKNKIS